jgi:hypothetical protein
MDGKQFDTWTRRRVGLTASGIVASLFAGNALSADAKKNKKQCRKLGQTCDDAKKSKQCCNKNQLCAQISGQGSSTFCCSQRDDKCSDNSDCCGNNKCTNGRCSTP